MAEREPIDQEERVRLRLNRLGEVFRPAGPIDEQDLFRGRLEQLARLNAVVHETGRHAVVYGERGVGKTSLAAVSIDICGPELVAARINCDVGDNFASLWGKLVERLVVMVQADSFADDVRSKIQTAIEILNFEEVSPGRVSQALAVVATASPVLLFFDEFDRVSEPMTRTLMADTIKALSDQLTRATIVIVGVADDVESLIAEHASISRSLAEIRMPRMSVDEIESILGLGFSALELWCGDELMRLLSHLPQGLPAYAHQLGRSCSGHAIARNRNNLEDSDLDFAIHDIVRTADESMTRAYVDATASSHKTLYADVLLACAITPSDEMGFFLPGDLREPLKKVTGESVDIPRFGRHLVQLATTRGPILERRGKEHQWRYRFREPMMRPYLIFRALSVGVGAEVLWALFPPPPPTDEGRLFSPDDFAPPP